MGMSPFYKERHQTNEKTDSLSRMFGVDTSEPQQMNQYDFNPSPVRRKKTAREKQEEAKNHTRRNSDLPQGTDRALKGIIDEDSYDSLDANDKTQKSTARYQKDEPPQYMSISKLQSDGQMNN